MLLIRFVPLGSRPRAGKFTSGTCRRALYALGELMENGAKEQYAAVLLASMLPPGLIRVVMDITAFTHPASSSLPPIDDYSDILDRLLNQGLPLSAPRTTIDGLRTAIYPRGSSTTPITTTQHARHLASYQAHPFKRRATHL